MGEVIFNMLLEFTHTFYFKYVTNYCQFQRDVTDMLPVTYLIPPPLVKHVELQYLLNSLVSESEKQFNKKVYEISKTVFWAEEVYKI